MKKIFASFMLSCALLLSVNIVAATAAAEYPTKPITLINPWYAGSVPDFVARAFAKASAKYLPQPMAVVIKSGGAGTIGIQNVLSSRPNGYTVGLGGGLLMTLQPHRAKLPWDNPGEFAVLGRIIQLSSALIVPKDAPYDTLTEFIAYMKAHPDKVRIAINGKGNIDGIAAAEMLYVTGTEAKIVPGATSLVPVLGKHADAQITVANKSILEFTDKIKILCVFSPTRYPFFEDVPTAREAGVDMDGYTAYYVLFGPKGLPADIKLALEKLVAQIANDSDYLEALHTAGIVPFYEDAQTAIARLEREYAASRELVERYDLKEE